MLRNFFKDYLKYLAQIALKKYNTQLIIIVGWDWAEGLREALYNTLKISVNVRRNTTPIGWDMALPLYILGYNYAAHQTKGELFKVCMRASLAILLPRKYNNYVIASVYSKQATTIGYWLSILPIDCLLILPFKTSDVQAIDELTASFNEKIAKLDLRSHVLLAQNTRPLQNKSRNLLKQTVFNMLLKVNELYLTVKKFNFTEEDLYAAVLKVDWEKYLLTRIKNNLRLDNEINK